MVHVILNPQKMSRYYNACKNYLFRNRSQNSRKKNHDENNNEKRKKKYAVNVATCLGPIFTIL